MCTRTTFLALAMFIGGCGAKLAVAADAAPGPAPAAGIASDRARAARQSELPAEGTSDKIMIEADVNLQADSVEDAAQGVRASIKKLGGKIVSDEILREANVASFVLRLPPARLDDFMAALAGLGAIGHRRIKSSDVTKQYVDTQIELDNMTQALTRYQEILKAATKVEEMLAVERELTRVRTDIERLKGELAYLSDRVELATVTVSVSSTDKGAVFAPEAKFHPGVSATYLAYLRSGHGSQGFVGPGFTLAFSRALHFDATVLRLADHSGFAADAIGLSLGGEAYSDFLGRGKRTFFNPFFGFNAGWQRVEHVDFVAAGIAAGVELVKTEYVLVDVAVKVAALANDHDVQLGIEPRLAATIAF